MNATELDILNALSRGNFMSQRQLAISCGFSLGLVNKSLKSLHDKEFIDNNNRPTLKADQLFSQFAPQNALILAAGFGMRMVPINTEIPKGLIEVHGERLIERLIRQLHEAGVNDIRMVVGFMKEQYEYLMDSYGVKLIVNPEYAGKNNLHSLSLAAEWIGNSYIIPCDLWFAENPFSNKELYSWYMVSTEADSDSSVRMNRSRELIKTTGQEIGSRMIGLSYITAEDAPILKNRIASLCRSPRHDGDFWEEALFDGPHMSIYARLVSAREAVEINTYEQLREIDSNSSQLKSEALDVIAEVLHAEPKDITQITMLKKGMTNRSFLFSYNDKKYIMRIPGEGTDSLINRRQEADVYHLIRGKGLCDDVLYINPDNGYKLTAYLPGVRVCDPLNPDDVAVCMKKLRSFHEMKLKAGHGFDLFEKIDFYEKLWGGAPSAYSDYERTKRQVLSLRHYIRAKEKEHILTHIDANHDNFLFPDGKRDEKTIQLIDWEYAAMQDPDLDIAMFGIYAMYGREDMERLINAYYPEGCPRDVRIKIYCYIAVSGLVWSNWCEYKRRLGVEFGEYSLRQYRFAKDYYAIICQELEKAGESLDAYR